MIDTVSSEVGNVSIQPKIINWINIAQLDLASKYVFRELHMYASLPAATNFPDVTLPTDFYWLKTIGIPTQHRKLYPIDEKVLAESFPQYRTLSGTVTRYYLSGTKLGLWQLPSALTFVDITYQKYPTKLTDSSEISVLPFEWHPLLIQKAITKGYSQEGNDSGFANSLQMEARLFKELQYSVYRRLDDTFVFDGPQTRGRLPRPKLPANYPNVGG